MKKQHLFLTAALLAFLGFGAPALLVSPTLAGGCGGSNCPDESGNSKTTIKNDVVAPTATSTGTGTGLAESSTTTFVAPSNANYVLPTNSNGSILNYAEGSKDFSRSNGTVPNINGVAYQTILGCIPAVFGMTTENIGFTVDGGYFFGIAVNIPNTKLAGGAAGAEEQMLLAMKTTNRGQALSLDLVEYTLGTKQLPEGATPARLEAAVNTYIGTQTRCNVTSEVHNNVQNITNSAEQPEPATRPVPKPEQTRPIRGWW